MKTSEELVSSRSDGIHKGACWLTKGGRIESAHGVVARASNKLIFMRPGVAMDIFL